MYFIGFGATPGGAQGLFPLGEFIGRSENRSIIYRIIAQLKYATWAFIFLPKQSTFHPK